MTTNNTGLEKFKRDWKAGDGIPVSWLTAVSNFVVNFKVTGSAVYTFNGHVPSLFVRGGGGGSATTHPLQILVAFDDDDEAEISVIYGMVDGKKDGTYTGDPTFDGGPDLLDDDPAPVYAATSAGDGDGTYTVYAKVTINSSYELTAGDIYFTAPGDSAPTDTAGSIYHWKIGHVILDDLGTTDRSADINQAVSSSLTVRVCESNDLALWGPK